MKKVIISEVISDDHKFNAGSKAREDIEYVFKECGYEVFSPSFQGLSAKKQNAFGKIMRHYNVYKQWKVQLSLIDDNSIVVFQFPIRPHTLLLHKALKYLKKKNCYIVAIVHDLECLRLANRKENSSTRSRRLIAEEKSSLPEFDLVIAHNNKMKSFLINSMNISEAKVEIIEIFDYLLHDFSPKKRNTDKGTYSIVIAGNLAKEKAGYLYCLPPDLHVELFGSNCRVQENGKIHYNGAFPPDELPNAITGDFGLVWDGPDSTTCAGTYGDYLRFNNPHKTSLYLACGLPVIVWNDAAIARFVKENACGIPVESLNDVGKTLQGLSESDYSLLKTNAAQIGEKLRNGLQTKRVVKLINKKSEVK